MLKERSPIHGQGRVDNKVPVTKARETGSFAGSRRQQLLLSQGAGFDLGLGGAPFLKHGLAGAGQWPLAPGPGSSELPSGPGGGSGTLLEETSIRVEGTPRDFWIWPVLLSRGARGGGQHEVSFFFFLKRFLKFIHERHRERGRDIGRGRSRFVTGSPMPDSILDPGIRT